MTPPTARLVRPTVLLQGRGVGVLEALREGLPAWGVEAFAALTHLGDTATVLALAALVYLAYDRRSGAFVGGTLLVAFGVVVALKGWFVLARPPAALRYVDAYGYGFPSGHAIGATVGWGATALALDDVWNRRRRFAAAGAIAGLVALSRVAIGVHYLVDVVVGVALGLVVLVAAARWSRESPFPVLVAATLVALVAVVVTGAGDADAAALLGATVGGVTAWQVVEPADRPWGRPGVVVSAAGAALALAGLAAIGGVPIVAAGGALLSAGLILAPFAAERWLPASVVRIGAK